MALIDQHNNSSALPSIGNYVIGGGAGTLDFVQRPCLFTRAGLLENAALVIKLPVPLRSAVTMVGRCWMAPV